MQKVAPAGFRVHYDFTRTSAASDMPDLLHRLAAFRVAGCFEDPLPPHDLSGYIDLRKRSRLPILTHHAPLDMTSDVIMGMAEYNIHDPQDHRFYIRPEKEIPLRYDEPIVTEYWTDDGSSEYERMFRRIEVEGTIVEREERPN